MAIVSDVVDREPGGGFGGGVTEALEVVRSAEDRVSSRDVVWISFR